MPGDSSRMGASAGFGSPGAPGQADAADDRPVPAVGEVADLDRVGGVVAGDDECGVRRLQASDLEAAVQGTGGRFTGVPRGLVRGGDRHTVDADKIVTAIGMLLYSGLPWELGPVETTGLAAKSTAGVP